MIEVTTVSKLKSMCVQARLRMVLSYLFASLLPTVRQRPGGGGLLVLASYHSVTTVSENARQGPMLVFERLTIDIR
jgi:hypothetical protein